MTTNCLTEDAALDVIHALGDEATEGELLRAFGLAKDETETLHKVLHNLLDQQRIRRRPVHERVWYI